MELRKKFHLQLHKKINKILRNNIKNKCVQKSGCSRLMAYSLKNPAYEVSPWLSPGNLTSEGLPPFPEVTRVAHDAYAVRTNDMIYAQHLLSPWLSEILAGTRQRQPI